MALPKLDVDGDWRYSDKPKREYVKSVQGGEYGTASSTLLDSVQAWNLAYLSFNIEATYQHTDPNFTVHVRRSLQTKLGSGELDITLASPYSGALGSLLLLPAPRFVALIMSHPVLKVLPLYREYGKKWLEIIEARAHLCGHDRSAQDEISDFSMAIRAISKFRLHP